MLVFHENQSQIKPKASDRDRNFTLIFNSYWNYFSKFIKVVEIKQQIGDRPSLIDVSSDSNIFSFDEDRSFEPAQVINYQEFIPAQEYTPVQTGIRFNVGGPKYTDVFGQVWQEDAYFNADSRKFSRQMEISGTNLDPIYQTERFSKNLSYSLPLENNAYDIKLHFAEIYFSGANRRVFDVSVEDGVVSKDLDLVAKSAKGEALAISLEDILVEDGILNLNLDASVNNAKLSGIEILPSNENSTIRINAGGNDYLDRQGRIWQADKYFTSSKTFSRPVSVNNTVEDNLFQTERFGRDFSYDIPLENGNYDVKLHFAEIYFHSEDRRIFDIAVETELIEDDLDLVAEVGAATSLVLELNDIAINDGRLNLNFDASVNNAKISAIEIIPVDPIEQNLAPVIELDTAGLGQGTVVDRLTNLTGSIIDEDLAAYRLEIAPVDLLNLDNLTEFDSDYLTIGEGTKNVVESNMATIDPSLFERGMYYARVYGRDLDGNVSYAGLFLEIDDPKGVYVATDGTAKGKGTKDDPVATLKDACKLLETHADLDTVYVREGVYKNPGHGSGIDNKSMGAITCSGTSDRYLTFRPYGEEKVKFAYDSFNGIRLKGNYINFQGFEVEGAAQDITYDEALDDWWTGNKKYNGNGIVINGHHINVRDNIVHNTPGSAIFINDGGDHSNITDNIIYNAAWWSTKGTTAIGMISAKDSKSDDKAPQSIKAERNLIFASESRIFSRVPTKGFAELAIDEGSGTLVQVNDGDYKGEYLIKDNFYLYNGKGVANRPYR